MAEIQTTERKREEECLSLDQAFSINLTCKTAEDWFNKGDALDDIEKREEAIECFNKCIAIKPDHAEAHYVKGFSLNVLGRKAEAMEAFNNAIKYDPKYVIAYVNRGKGYVGLQKEKEALADFTKAQELAKGGLKADRTLTQANIAFIQNSLGPIVEAQKVSQEGEAIVAQHGQTNPIVLKYTVKSKLMQEEKKKNITKALELLNKQDEAEAAKSKTALDKNREDLKKAVTETQDEIKKLATAQQDAKKQLEDAQKKLGDFKDQKLGEVQSQLKDLKDVDKLKDLAGLNNKDGKKAEDMKTSLTNKFDENKKELTKNADDLKKQMEGKKDEATKAANEMKDKMKGMTDIKGVKGQDGRACCNMF